MSEDSCELGSLADFESFKRIIKWYLRYILISGCRYCRGKNELAYISCYTLVCFYKGIRSNKDVRIGVAIDAMLDSVGENMRLDQLIIGNLYEGSLFEDENLFEIADALNILDGFHRQLVILYNMEMMTTQQLGLLYDLPIWQIRKSLEIGEIQLEQELKKRGIKCENAPETVNMLGQKIDEGVLNTVVMSIGDYLEETKFSL